MKRKRTIFLIDCLSFYASIEKAAQPELRDKPVAIGDPARPSGIILAACPKAKSYGVRTAQRLFEARAVCRDLVVVRPRMRVYIAISLLLTRLYEGYTDQVEPYSNDEQFLDVTGSLLLFRTEAEELARQIQEHAMLSTGVWVRVGIGPTKVLAKMATDNFAKRTGGVYRLDDDNIERDLWPLPISQMFMVGGKMTYHFERMGISTIGDLARMDLHDFKKRLRLRMGKQSDIQAAYYWQTARGIDPSPVEASIRGALRSVSHGKTLRSSEYYTVDAIEVVLLELCIEVCRRARRLGYQGTVVSLGISETDGQHAHAYSRQVTLPHATSLTHEVADAALRLFEVNWRGCPVSGLHISLTGLSDDRVQQLTLFDDRAAKYELEHAIDGVKDRYGEDAIIRASSLLDAGIARERADQIGGHFA